MFGSKPLSVACVGAPGRSEIVWHNGTFVEEELMIPRGVKKAARG
jgi:hypothetical protein